LRFIEKDEAQMSTDENDKLPTVDDTRLVTVGGAVALINAVYGIPIPKSRFQKDRANGIAPAPDAIYGRTHLFKPTKILAYGRTLIRPFLPKEVA
jgi:hypothetical protein